MYLHVSSLCSHGFASFRNWIRATRGDFPKSENILIAFGLDSCGSDLYSPQNSSTKVPKKVTFCAYGSHA